jgi:spoIIIJ-associated protein
MAADLDQDVVKFVREVTGAMGLEVTIELEETPDHVRLNLTGNGADVLLKRQGDTLDALQVLVNTVFRRHERGDRHYVIDALGFRRDKDRELRQMATFLVEKARTTGLVQQIGPLNPYARRIVHLAVAEHPDVTSESVGDAFLKTVMISSRAR